MKNLKYTKTFVSIALAGVLLTGCNSHCDVKDKHYHIYTNDDGAIYSMKENLDEYSKKSDYILLDDKGKLLFKNNLFPFDDVSDYIYDVINNKEIFVQAKNAKPYIDENGDLKFDISWRLLTDAEAKNYNGIARSGNNLKFVVYTLKKNDKGLDLNRVEIDNLENLKDEYYINPDDFIIIENATLGVYNNGKINVRK